MIQSLSQRKRLVYKRNGKTPTNKEAHVFVRYGVVLLIVLVLVGCGGKSKEELYAEGLEKLKQQNPGAAVVLFKSALEKDQNFIDARFQLAKAFVDQGKPEQAEKEFLKVLSLNPSKEEVNLELARVYIATKRPEEGFKLADTYLAKHPNHAESYEIMGISSAVRELYPDAEAYLQKAIAADPANHRFSLELASVYVAQKQPAKAREALDKVIAADSKNLRAWYMLAALNQLEGKTAAALDTYRKITEISASETQALYRSGLLHIQQKELDKADALADGMIRDFPKKADGYRLKGLVQFQRKQYAEATASLQNAVKIVPTLDAYYYLGLSSYNRGEYEGALSHFRKVLDHAPQARQARLMTAMVLLAQKRTDDAITEINKVIKQHEQDAEAYNLLGSAYMAKGMFEEGVQALNTALKINPKSADAHIKKGSYYFTVGKTGEGEAELLAAVQVAPDQLGNRLLLAATYLRTNKPQKAFDLLKAGLNNSKTDAPLYSSMATVMFMQNKRDEGIKYLQLARQRDPAFAPAYQRMATLHAVSGKYDQAIQEYQALLKQTPDNLQAMLQLAALYEVAGKESEALAQYQQAKASKKAGAYAAEAQYFMRKQQPDKALASLDEAQKLEPKNPQLLELKAQVLSGQKKYKEVLKLSDEMETLNADAGIALKIQTYMRMKQSDKALVQARRVIEKYPRSARGYQLLASIYEFDKKYPEAIAEVKKGVQVDPKDLQARLYLGNLQAANKEYDVAAATYADILKIQQYAPAMFAQGALLQQGGKKAEAAGRYRASLAVAERYVPALNNLSYLCAEGFCSKEEALTLAMKAFKLEPTSPGVLDTLGYALLVNGKYDDARKVLEKAAALLPNQPTVQYHLAMVYKQTGNKQGALQALSKALSLGAFPEADAARRLQSELQR